MRRLLPILLLSLTLGACATNPDGTPSVSFGTRVSNVASAITSATVDPQTIIIAASSFDALQATAKNYLQLPLCRTGGTPVCRQASATVPIIQAVRAGRKARSAAVAFVKTHPGQLGPGGLYDALATSVATIESIFQNYQVKAVAN